MSRVKQVLMNCYKLEEKCRPGSPRWVSGLVAAAALIGLLSGCGQKGGAAGKMMGMPPAAVRVVSAVSRDGGFLYAGANPRGMQGYAAGR